MNHPWLKAPSHKRAERRVIEDNVSCAFKHSSSRDIALKDIGNARENWDKAAEYFARGAEMATALAFR